MAVALLRVGHVERAGAQGVVRQFADAVDGVAAVAQVVAVDPAEVVVADFADHGQAVGRQYPVEELGDGHLCLGHRLAHVAVDHLAGARGGEAAVVDRVAEQGGRVDRGDRHVGAVDL